MMNYIWLGLLLAAVLLGGFSGQMPELTVEGLKAAKVAVIDIALPLTGIFALWLGIMRLAERSGLVQILARALRPLMRRLFPDVPAEHPAMGSMLMNIAANVLGLGNAATALGLRAMTQLEKLNPNPGTATNAMCTFLAINTSSVQLIPATTVGILAVANSLNPSAIIGTALIATTVSTIVGISTVKWLEKLPLFRIPAAPAKEIEALEPVSEPEPELAPLRWWGMALLFLFLGCFAAWFILDAFFHGAFERPVLEAAKSASLFSRVVGTISVLAIPFFLTFFPLYAGLRGVKVYEEFVEGAKEGFHVGVRIIPYLVAILVAVAMFRASGGDQMLSRALAPVLNLIGFPSELLQLVLVRPLSGSATTAIFTDLVRQFGPDSLIARMAGTIMGSTETTFYVIAVYFGAVAVRKTRHAIAAGLAADLAGVIAAVIICRWMF